MIVSVLPVSAFAADDVITAVDTSAHLANVIVGMGTDENVAVYLNGEVFMGIIDVAADIAEIPETVVVGSNYVLPTTLAGVDGFTWSAELDTAEIGVQTFTLNAQAGVKDIVVHFAKYQAEKLRSDNADTNVAKQTGARSWRVMRSDSTVEFDVVFDAGAFGGEAVTRHIVVNF